MQAKHERPDIFIGAFNPSIASVRLRQCSCILTIARAKPEPKEQHGKEGACGVDDRVVGRGVAAGDEGLMYLVESGVGGGQEERQPARAPRNPRYRSRQNTKYSLKWAVLRVK